MDMNKRLIAIEQTLREYGQEHVLTFWDDLSVSERKSLLSELESIDFSFLKKCFDEHLQVSKDSSFEPPKVVVYEELSKISKAKGENVLRNNKLAILIVAGGQGTRLGYDGPKGLFEASAVKKKSLFQLLCEQILARQKKYDVIIDLFIMTSRQNHDASITFFEEHEYFGLNKESVVFFEQNLLPAIDTLGKLLLKNPSSLSLSPSGTGAIYDSLLKAGLLKRMEEKNIEYLYYAQIDNPLAPVADPVFIGAHVQDNAQMSTLVVEKAYPAEKVGVIVEQEGRTRVCEYIHLPEEKAQLRDEKGALLYNAANIAIHILNREFIQTIAKEHQLPVYLAHKKITCIDTKGNHLSPIDPNAYKFESFVFDALPKASTTVNVMIARDDAFAPIKNESGKDSPASSCETQTRKYKKWLRAAGISDHRIDALEEVEISPLFALSQDDFVKKILPHKSLVDKQLKGKKFAYVD